MCEVNYNSRTSCEQLGIFYYRMKMLSERHLLAVAKFIVPSVPAIVLLLRTYFMFFCYFSVKKYVFMFFYYMYCFFYYFKNIYSILTLPKEP